MIKLKNNNLKNIFIIFLVSTNSILYSQNVNLDDLIYLKKKDMGGVEEFLTLKGWSYIRGEEPNDENLGIIEFAYKKSTYDDKAESFIKYFYSEKTANKRINIQIVNVEKYKLFLERIKALNCNLIKSKIEDGSIIKIYRGKNLTFEITISTQKNDFESTSTTYLIFITNNIDYKNNFEKEEFYTYSIDKNVDTTAVYYHDFIKVVGGKQEDEIEEVVVLKEDILLNELFFIGNWTDAESNFTFKNNGEFILKVNNGEIITTKWKFINNILIVGEMNNLITYNIFDYDENYLKFNTNKNEKIYYAFRKMN